MKTWNENNPLRSVDGSAVLCPTTYQWALEDVSASDAGRTEDVAMHKKRIGQVVKLELSWEFITTEEVSEILQAFDPEYVMVCYLDAKQGKFVTSEFYVGNRTAPMFNASSGLWENVAFNIIERYGA